MNDWDDAEMMLARAQAAHARGDQELAYQMFARASELSPQNAQAWRGRAQTTSSPDEALVSYGYAVALAPAEPSVHAPLADALAKRIETASPADAPLLVILGQELAEVGLADGARPLFQRAVDLDRTSTDALVWLAGVTPEAHRALDYLRQAITQSPEDQRAQSGLAALTLQLHPVAAAAPAPARAADPQLADLIQHGEGALARGDKVLAHQLFIKATDAAPENQVAWLRRAASTDDEAEQFQCYERVLAINPENSAAREAHSLIRLRKLRETARLTPLTEKSQAMPVAASLRAATRPAASDVWLRRVLLILLILFALLFLAGILLLTAR